ncbi:MAG: hypothetical protein ACK47M_12715 [Caldilinea sp.]
MRTSQLAGIVVLVLIFILALQAPSLAIVTTAPTAPLPAIPPPLPFHDNPDPTLCGIPQPDGRQGTVTGKYAGEVVQPIVYLYDSHSRNQVVGQVYPGTRVKVEFSQINPELNFYFVRTIGVTPAQSGWIPAPFLVFADQE